MVAEVLIPGDNTSLVILQCEGYRRYRLDHKADLHLEENIELPDVTKFEPILGGCWDVIVTSSSPNKIKTLHKETLAITREYSYSFNVLAVRTNRKRVVVYTDETIFIHQMPNMKLLHAIKDAHPNPRGLLALTKNCVNCLLAYPESATSGNVQIFDAGRLQQKTLIRAHKNSLAALDFDTSGTRIATASRTGCVIKVFSSDDGQPLYEFQRGLARCVDVCSLTFSTCDKYLCCNSNTETVHVFSVNNYQDSWTGYLSSFVFRKRAFATAYLPKKALQSVSSVATVGNQLRLLVATEEGHLYVYSIDPNTGGVLSLLKQHRIGYYSEPSNLYQSLKEDSEDSILTEDSKDSISTEVCEDSISAEDSEDSISTKNNKDSILTEDSEDSISTKDNKDSISTKDNKDSILTENSEDNISTEDSENSITTEDNKNSILTEDSKDSISSENSEDSISSEDSEDSISSEYNKNSILTEDSKDSISTEDSEDSISSEDSEDSISSDDSEDSISSEDSEDSISSEDSEDSISSEDNKNSILTEDSEEYISTEDNKNSILTEDNKDSISSEDSKDSISSEDNKNSILTEDSEEYISTEDNKNSILTEDSKDSISTEDSEDSFSSEDWEDSISSEDSEDSISSEDSEDSISTEDSEDSISTISVNSTTTTES